MNRYNELPAEPRVEIANVAVRAHPGGGLERSMRPDETHIDLAYPSDLIAWLDGALRAAHGR